MKIKNFLLGLIRSVLCVVLCILTVASCLSFLASTFLDEWVYAEKVANEKYVDQIEVMVIDKLESDSLYYDIPIEYVKAAITRDELTSISKEYVRLFVKCFKTGAKDFSVGYDRNLFVEQINKYLTDYPEIGVYYEEETVYELADEFTATVDNTINSFINISIIEDMARSVYSNKYIAFLSNNFYQIIGLALICCGLIFICGGKYICWSLYRVFGSIWCGSVILVIPAFLVKNNDLISKIILDESPFKTLIAGIYDLILNNWLNYSALLFIISGVLLLASIILVSVIKKQNKENIQSERENEKD